MEQIYKALAASFLYSFQTNVEICIPKNAFLKNGLRHELEYSNSDVLSLFLFYSTNYSNPKQIVFVNIHI